MSETKVKNKISIMILVVILAAVCAALVAGCSGLLDKVSYNEFSGGNEAKEVTQLFRSSSLELTRLTTSDGQEILSTPSHPYYTQRGYVDAQNLRAGDVLRTVNGETVIVEAVQHELLESSQILYNFEVDGNNNYFVAENTNADRSDFILAHNYCNKVYIAKVTNNNGVDDIYVGRTKRELKIRFAEHEKNAVHPRELEAIKVLDDNISDDAMRGLEQEMINRGGGIKKLDNVINAVGENNKKRLRNHFINHVYRMDFNI